MSHTRKMLKGSASNLARVFLATLVALVLPPFLVHRMPQAEYSAWVLVLQISTYIGLLDLGLQTAISKFVAEYSAAGDRTASGRVLSSSFAILSLSAVVGSVIVCVVTWQVPRLFHQMPTSLIGEVRQGILAVGLSTVVSLPFSAFLAAFMGLQMYGFPTALAMISKVLSSATLVTLLLMHGSFTQLAWTVAGFNIATAFVQFLGWKRYTREHFDFSTGLIDLKMASRLAKFGSVLSIWTVSVLLISGLDMVIVGHYDYINTGYYGIASGATNFMLLIVGSLFGPLLPAVSSLQAGRSPAQIGDIVIRTTRYCLLLVFIIGLPLLFGAYPLLRGWVGSDYALHSALFLEVLIVGNAIRQFGYPYALVVVATGQQHLATVAAVTEAIINISLSIYLVQRVGAVGVAIGTLAGAFVSVGLHVGISMKLTHSSIGMTRSSFLLKGIARPLACLLPSLLLLPFWRKLTLLPANPIGLAGWAFATLSAAWLVGLTPAERDKSKNAVFRLI